MAAISDIDVSEKELRSRGDLLDTLLIDQTTKKNIIWATDSYLTHGDGFAPKRHILPELVTGVYSKIIQPRAAKSLVEQRFRTKEKAEVFTSLKTVDQMNRLVDSAEAIKRPDKSNWQDYISELKLEITCGEAPFIVSRYNPTAHTGKLIQLESRVGFLDKKLRVVSRYCDEQAVWLYWAKEAYKASYGYEWQGDNVLIARENLLYTLVDYYQEKFDQKPSLGIQQEFAEIVSWNIFQMDGIRCVATMSCHHVNRIVLGDLTLFGLMPDIVEKDECEGCKFNRVNKHNGKYVKVMDWKSNKIVKFVDLLSY